MPLHTGARPRRGPDAFTLIELMVVVAVIGTLMGIMLPALGSAREAGRSAKCASNMRQLHLGWALYTQNNNGRIAPARDYSDAAMRAGYRNRFWGGAWSADGEYVEKGAILHPYAGDLATRACPTWMAEDSYGALGIGYNTQYFSTPKSVQLGGAWTFNWFGEHRMKNACKTVVFADCATIRPGASPELQTTYFLWGPSAHTPAFHGRHNGRGNVCWADGHVTSETPKVLRDSVVCAGPAGTSFTVTAEQARSYHVGDIDTDDDPETDECWDPEYR